MSLTLTQLIIIFAGSLCCSAFFSMLEAAVISQDKHRVQHLAEEGEARALAMHRLLMRTDRLLATLLLCNNLANVTCAAVATAIGARLMGGGDAVLLPVTLVVTFILLVFAEIAPKVIGVRYSSAIALTLAYFLNVLIKVFKPLTAITGFCSNSILALLGFKKSETSSWYEAMNVNELRALVRSAARDAAGGAEGKQAHYHIVENTLHFNELTVEKIMTPRRDIVGLNLHDAADELSRQIEAAGHNELVLYQGHIDEAVGVVHTLDAIKLIKDDRLSAAELKAISAPVGYIPASATALQQLHNLRRQQKKLSLVVDGSGRVIGLLTFTNFAAAIIGDETIPPLQYRHDGALLVSGDTTLLQLEQMLPGTRAPDNIDAATVNGMILEHLGDVPERTPQGVKIKDWRIEILEADDKSVQRVAIMPPRHESAAPVD